VDKYFVQARLDVQEQEAKKDLDNPGGQEVMAKYGGDKAGLPFFAFLDEKGGMIVNSLQPQGGNIGHPVEPGEVDWFLAMVKKAAPAMTADEAKVLENWLRTQKK
jgi:hypothetical protein